MSRNEQIAISFKSLKSLTASYKCLMKIIHKELP